MGVKFLFLILMGCLALEFFGQSGLFQNRIGRVPGFNMIIDNKVDDGNRAVPDLMITPTLPYQTASSFPQMLLQGSRKISH